MQESYQQTARSHCSILVVVDEREESAYKKWKILRDSSINLDRLRISIDTGLISITVQRKTHPSSSIKQSTSAPFITQCLHKHLSPVKSQANCIRTSVTTDGQIQWTLKPQAPLILSPAANIKSKHLPCLHLKVQTLRLILRSALSWHLPLLPTAVVMVLRTIMETIISLIVMMHLNLLRYRHPKQFQKLKNCLMELRRMSLQVGQLW